MTNSQIVSAYENSNISVDQLAEVFDLEIGVVKMALNSGSRKFRQNLKESTEYFDKKDVDFARDAMVGLLQCEIDAVRFRSAKYILDEKKGRNDVKELSHTNINVNLINVQMQRAIEAADRAKQIKGVHKDVIKQELELTLAND